MIFGVPLTLNGLDFGIGWDDGLVETRSVVIADFDGVRLDAFGVTPAT